jgi:hypothetical protein
MLFDLVHCKAGKGRSATVVVCYLMEQHRWTPEQAAARIAKLRPWASEDIEDRETVQEVECVRFFLAEEVLIRGAHSTIDDTLRAKRAQSPAMKFRRVRYVLGIMGNRADLFGRCHDAY